MQLQRILLALDLPNSSSPLLQQAAYLARHYAAEVVAVHVLTPWRYPAGIFERGHEMIDQDRATPDIQRVQHELEELLHPHLDALPVKTLLIRGQPAQQIARSAREHDAQLIMLSTHRRSVLWQLLSASVTGRLLHETDRPLWTDAAAPAGPVAAFALRRVLCAVDLGPHSRHTLLYAAQLAADFGAELILVHVTVADQGAAGSEGRLSELERELRTAAAQELDQLQRECGTRASVLIDSGDALSVLRRAVEHSGSDLLVIGHLPEESTLGSAGSGVEILRTAPIPVLSV
jgi:nucleotide-binding universal stress UspA family protein